MGIIGKLVKYSVTLKLFSSETSLYNVLIGDNLTTSGTKIIFNFGEKKLLDGMINYICMVSGIL